MDFPATRSGAMAALLVLVLITPSTRRSSPSAGSSPIRLRRRSRPSSSSASRGARARKGTAWKVHFARGMHRGLYITGAWYKRSLGEDWIKILNDARVAELFVPYHQASYIRYFDLTGFSFPMAEVRRGRRGRQRQPDAPVPGRSLSDRGQGGARPRRGLEGLRPRRPPRQGAGDLGSPRGRQLHVHHVLWFPRRRHDQLSRRRHRPEPARPSQGGPHAQRPLADRHRPDRRQEEFGDGHAARRGPREPGSRGHRGAVQPRATKGASTGTPRNSR